VPDIVRSGDGAGVGPHAQLFRPNVAHPFNITRSYEILMDSTRTFNSEQGRLFRLSCSLTSCCDWSGESPDGGRFPVRPSSLIPRVIR
jgi:hypothetical protein